MRRKLCWVFAEKRRARGPRLPCAPAAEPQQWPGWIKIGTLALARFPASPPELQSPRQKYGSALGFSLGCLAWIAGIAALLYPRFLNNLSSIIRLIPNLQSSPVSSYHTQDHPCWIRAMVSLAQHPLGQWPRTALREESIQTIANSRTKLPCSQEFGVQRLFNIEVFICVS